MIYNEQGVMDIASDRSFAELVTDKAWTSREAAVADCVRVVNDEITDTLEPSDEVRFYAADDALWSDDHDGDQRRWVFHDKQTCLYAVLFEITVEGL
jgi:hypothetical protein